MNTNTAGGVFPSVGNPLTNYKNYEHYYHTRKPKRVTVFCNGDQYFPGKTITITPHRYLSINDMMNDITHKLPSSFRLPYGVRQLFTPTGGRRVKKIDDIKDGENYVVGGFEAFKLINYGAAGLKPWRTPAKAQAVNLNEMYNFYDQKQQGYVSTNSFQPNRHAFRGMFGYRKQSLTGSYNATAQKTLRTPARTRPRLITIIRNSTTPRTSVKLLLNRQGVTSYEQLMDDVTEAMGPKWKYDRVQKMFNSKGRPVNGLVDFFRQKDNLFIATGSEALTARDVVAIVNDYNKSEEGGDVSPRRLEQKHELPAISERKDRLLSKPDDKRDSGFQDEIEGDEIVAKPQVSQDWKKKKFEPVTKSDLVRRLEQERLQAAEKERERAHRRMENRVEREMKAMEEQRHKQGLSPLKSIEVSLKKLQQEKKQRRGSKEVESASPPKLGPIADRETESRQILEQMKEDEKKDQKKTLKELLESRKGHKLPDIAKHPDVIENHSTSSPVKSEFSSPAKIPSIKQSPDPSQRSSKNESVAKITDPIELVAKENTPEGVEEDLAEVPSKTPDKSEEPVVDNDVVEIKEEKDADQIVDVKAEKEEEPDQPELPSRDEGDMKDTEQPAKAPGKEEEAVEPAQPEEEHQLTPVLESPAPKPRRSKSEASKHDSDKENKPDEMSQKPPIPKQDKKDNLEDLRKKHRHKKIERGRFVREVSNADRVYERFELGKVMGDGNFAIVRQCRAKLDSKEYALKIIDKAKLKGKEHMIENEIKIMKVCDHPNIVKLHEEYETKAEIFLVMELVRGGDLFDCITASVKFEEKVAAGMVQDLANALYYLHSRKVVHRDIKPENLLVFRAKDGNLALKLGDFGLAMEVTELIFTVCGTPTYVAPEILKEIGYGLEIDLWATGVITYILLCGFPPFRSAERKQSELFSLIKSGVYEFLRPYWDNATNSAKDLISRLLVVNRRDRYTAIDVLCHPWIVTRGGTVPLPDNFESHQRTKKAELERLAKQSRDKFVAQKTLNKTHGR